MERPEEIYLRALKEIQGICYPILDSGKYGTSHAQIADIASGAIHKVNDLKLSEIKSIYNRNEELLSGEKEE